MKILFFDGYCTLCNGLVDWFMRVDRSKRLKFASLQGETALRLLQDSAQDLHDPETVVYYRDGKTYLRSAAILKSLGDLEGLWTLSGLFFIIPPFARDAAYRIIARNRYKLFGKKDTCRVATAQERERLLS